MIPRFLSFSRHYATAPQLPLKLYSLEGRYASALFLAASKQDELSKTEAEIRRISSAITKSSPIQTFLADPTTGREKKKAIVTELLQENGAAYSEIVVNLFRVMAENGRLGLAPKVINAFDELMRAHRGEIEVLITSYKELPRETVERLKDTIAKQFIPSGKTLKLSTKVNPSIMGGVIVQVGDKTVDMSVVSRVNALRKELGEEL